MREKFRFNRGFGLLEVLIAAVVLGFLIVGLNKLQMGNREMVLRVRARDAAQIVAQEFIDSLSSLGLAAIPDTIIDSTTRTWQGSSIIKYKINAGVKDASFKSVESSYFTRSIGQDDTMHVTAKRIDLTVIWPFKNSTQSINISRIIK